MGAAGFDYWQRHLAPAPFLDWHEALYGDLLSAAEMTATTDARRHWA